MAVHTLKSKLGHTVIILSGKDKRLAQELKLKSGSDIKILMR